MFIYKAPDIRLRTALMLSMGIFSATVTPSVQATVYSGIESFVFGQSGTSNSAATHLLVSQPDPSPYYAAAGFGITLEGDSAAGTLRLSVSEPAGDTGVVLADGTKVYAPHPGSAWVSFSESGTFGNFKPGDIGYLAYSIHGSFTNNIPPDGLGPSTGWGTGYGGNAYGMFGVGVFDGTTNFVKSYNFATDAHYCPNNSVVCLIGEDPGTQIGVLAIPLSASNYTFSSGLKMSVQGYTANFSNTGRLYLSLPAGVTFTSSSGTFLSQATPIASVPEPESYAMLLAGLGLVGVVVRRGKKELA